MAAPCLGGGKSAVFAAFLLTATLGMSRIPTEARYLEAESIAGTDCAEGDPDDCTLMLEDFSSPKHKWVEMNDPVMGGKSTGTFHVDESANVGVFHGSVETVSFLNAPGFIKAETAKGESWPDASSCSGLQFALKSSTPSYGGFRVSFGSKRPPDAFPYAYGFKADLKLDAASKGFRTVRLPFENFTDEWDAGTGDAVATCAENEEYCPGVEDKKNLFSIAVWGEGVEGEVDLRIRSVAAYGCNGAGGDDGDDAESESEDVAEDVPVGISLAGSDAISIEDFSRPAHEWKTMNDPVMGGKSESSVSFIDGMARFEGTCAIVPFLRAPGFITMVTGGYFSKDESFPDVSNCVGLTVGLRSKVEYEGYYLSFGTDRVPGGRHASGYKTHLNLAASDEFSEIRLPFSDFSSEWDETTGKTKVTCKEDPQYCPSLDNLRDMKTISFWGEGVEGRVALDVESIGAYECTGDDLGGELAAERLAWGTAGPSSRTPWFGWLGVGAVLAFGVVVAKRRNNTRRSADYEEVDVPGVRLT